MPAAFRPYWFEIFTIANLIVIEILLRRIGLTTLSTLPLTFLGIGATIVAQLIGGVAIRAVLARIRHVDYLGVIRSRAWLADTARICVVSVLWAHAYGWIKLAIPLLHPRLFDQQLWDADRAIFFGLSPNVFFLNLFAHPAALRAIDWTYANVFVASLFIAAMFFLSHPDRTVRIRFMNANTTMWLAGAWLYVALPSLGPAYRFPELWLPLSAYLTETQRLQRLLMTNYQAVLQTVRHPRPVNVLFGIAAFPSLHVAFEALVLLQIRKLSRVAKNAWIVFLILIFVGSVVTGWHYLIDSIAGLLLAVACHAAFQLRPPRFRRHATTD